MGYIPNMKKPNQDSSLIDKDLGGIKGLWMLGVFDGHGINGHMVSDFAKKHIPYFLGNILNNDHELANNNITHKEIKGKAS